MSEICKDERMTLRKSAELCSNAEKRALLGEPWIERQRLEEGSGLPVTANRTTVRYFKGL